MARAYDTRGLTAGDLRRILIPAELPEAEEHRRYYGRGLNPGQIESALRQAQSGLFVDLTDLEDEALSLDPHASGVLAKRFGSLACLDWSVDEAEGRDVDPGKAAEYADQVRRSLERIPNLQAHLYHLAWGLYYNRSASEIHWSGPHAGEVRWAIEGLRDVHPRRLAFGPSRELLLIDTFKRYSGFVSEYGAPLDDFPGKFLTWIPRMFNVYPEADGLGPRILYWSFFKRFSWRMRMQLTELFGIPWRIIEADPEMGVDWQKLDEAAAQVERLGRTNTAQLPPGAKLNVIFPGEQSGNLFELTDEGVDRQISKLVLGNTGTTEGGEANRANSIIQKGEQEILLTLDAGAVSWRIQRCLVEPFVAFNHGPEEVSHAPRFRLRAEPPRDVEKDLANAAAILGMGLPIAEAQVRERTGWRSPDEGEVYVLAGGPIDPNEQTGDTGLPMGPPGPPTPPRVEGPDDLAKDAGALEEGGDEAAAANAVADLLAATGINMSPGARRALGTLASLRGSEVATTFALDALADRGRKVLGRETLRRRCATFEARRHERAVQLLGASDDHGHGFAAFEPEGARRFSIQGEADHDHAVELDADQALAISLGRVVRVTSSPAPDGHRHHLAIGRPLDKRDELLARAAFEDAEAEGVRVATFEGAAGLVGEGFGPGAALRVALANAVHFEGRDPDA
jgi:phage gp29-like protein